MGISPFDTTGWMTRGNPAYKYLATAIPKALLCNTSWGYGILYVKQKQKQQQQQQQQQCNYPPL